MNLAPGVSDALKKQPPTYRLAPNWTTRPFPDGPYELGTLVEDIEEYYPINQGATNLVPIPDGQRYSDSKEDISASVKTSRSGEASIFAKVLDRSIGGDASLKGQKSDEDVFKIEKLETVYFFPNRSYINKCLKLRDVKEYIETGSYEHPVYLITGLKIAWGATISTERDRAFEGGAGISATIPSEAIDVNIGTKASLSGNSAIPSSFGKGADFILGIQLQKIYHKKKFWTAAKIVEVEKVRKGAVLVDNDELKEDEDNDDTEDQFIFAEMEDGEQVGFVPHIGQESKFANETWLIPADIA
ncbi:hypothetical protein N0V90_001013 [Kalmusia sp. IMI 367209]|nr:hypothetical protein N0V90_001013 [Kalmusia sp. IMI 367209]